MNDDLIRRSDVLDFLEAKILACMIGSEAEAALESAREAVIGIRGVISERELAALEVRNG